MKCQRDLRSQLCSLSTKELWRGDFTLENSEALSHCFSEQVIVLILNLFHVLTQIFMIAAQSFFF